MRRLVTMDLADGAHAVVMWTLLLLAFVSDTVRAQGNEAVLTPNMLQDNYTIPDNSTQFEVKILKPRHAALDEVSNTESALLNTFSARAVMIEPAHAVRRIGDELLVICRVTHEIDTCRFSVSRLSLRLQPGEQTGDMVYYGEGLKNGQCGIRIKHVQESFNGNITCLLPPPTGNVELEGTMQLIVAKKPRAPVLRAPDMTYFKEGDEFKAQCSVADGRPAANISWYIGDKRLERGAHKPVEVTDPTTGMVSTSQNLTLELSAEHAGKALICRAEHAALDEPMEVARQLVVHYAPKIEEPVTSIFGLKLGTEGRLNVTVRAAPYPTAQWRAGDLTLVPPQTNDLGTVTALESIPLGDGYYNFTLVLSHIMKEDVERKYYLRVTNALGQQESVVQLSTLDEPYGLELTPGQIVGIVIGVSVIVLIAAVFVFARATHRWCFPGTNRGRDHPKASGESTPAGDVLLESGMPLPSRTDTESAVGGKERSRLAALGARMRAVLPRPKEKPQGVDGPAAEAEEKPLSEDKKAVVYAELQLGEQPRDKPSPPSTEYAEIVYSDQPKETKE